MTPPTNRVSAWDRMLNTSTWISVLRNLWWAFVTVAALITALAILIASTSVSFRVRVTLIIIATSAVALPVGALLHRWVFRRKEVPLGYRLVKETSVLRFDPQDRRRQEQDVSVEIEARRDNLTLFSNRYHWTGHGSERLTLLSDSQVLLANPDLRDEYWETYYVHFRDPLLRGDLETIRVKHHLYDQHETFKPIHVKHVSDDIESLTLQVIFPTDMPAEDKIYGIERTGDRGHVVGRPNLDYDAASGSVYLKIKNPHKHNTYAIQWSWDYPPPA